LLIKLAVVQPPPLLQAAHLVQIALRVNIRNNRREYKDLRGNRGYRGVEEHLLQPLFFHLQQAVLQQPAPTPPTKPPTRSIGTCSPNTVVPLASLNLLG
jgi:hypothetical protein